MFEAQQLTAAGASPLPPLVAVRKQLPPEVGVGRRYVAALRFIVLAAAVFFTIAIPAALALLRSLTGG